MGSADAQQLFEYCSNTGRWGVEDERGTLNFIDAPVVLRALATVTAGEVVALGRLTAPRARASDDGTLDFLQLQVFRGPTGRDALDRQTLAPHGFELTHLDAVGHTSYGGFAYNGRLMDDVVRAEGLSSCGVEAAASGIVTRAVLLDVARSRGRARLDPDEGISAEDLADAERAAGLAVLRGDAVLVRAGTGGAGPTRDGRRAGLLASAVRWLHDHEIALYGGDCIERLPGEDVDLPMVLHQIGHAAMGLAILDNPDIASAREACDRHGRSAFLLIVAPLPLKGGTGSLVNPLGIF
jgi:kynurenine formamidase